MNVELDRYAAGLNCALRLITLQSQRAHVIASTHGLFGPKASRRLGRWEITE
jgi:hypothetical protein